MTVKELIEVLSSFNPNARVIPAESDPYDYSRIVVVLPSERAKYKYSYVIKDDGSTIMIGPELDIPAVKG